jgi:hypothetical protein
MVKKQQIHLNIYLLSKITEHRRLGRHNLLFNRYFGNLVVCSLIFYYGQKQQFYRNIIINDIVVSVQNKEIRSNNKIAEISIEKQTMSSLSPVFRYCVEEKIF